MIPIKNNLMQIDDIHLHKAQAIEKIKKAIDFTKEQKDNGLTKLASSNASIIDLFMAMLNHLNLDTDRDKVGNLIDSLSANTAKGIEKTSTTLKNSERRNEIKIVSKAIKDSHYQIDVSKDVIVHKGEKVFMVSCYARDAYLGRYMIKRNYFYTMDREASADEAYDEIDLKMKKLKDRYYNEIIDVPAICAQAKIILDGVISEVDFKEDSLGTTVNRHPYENNRNR